MSSNSAEQQSREIAEAAREAEWTLPSFGKELFLGNFRLDLIHPQPLPEPEAVERGERFIARLRQFLETEVDPFQIERDSKVPEEVINGLKRLGALGMKVPEEYGGLGLSLTYYNRALMLVNSWSAGVATLLSAHQSIGLSEPLRLSGTEEQKRKWLPLVARDHISAFMLTEPDVGSDPARLATSASPVEGGYVLNGRKLWATNGAVADVVVVIAKVPRREGERGGITAFIVPCDLEGVTLEHRNAFMGIHGIENSVTRFENVFIPAENRIGREGEGLKIALSTLNSGRLGIPAICAAASKWSTKVAREWSNERIQWGRPIGQHDAVAQKIAFIAGSAFGLEAMLEVSCRLADNKSGDIRIEAALAKLHTSELGWKVVDELVQIRGGRGYETADSLKARGEKPVPTEALFRDMRIHRIFEGSTEIMHLLIAREAVDQHLHEAGDLLTSGTLKSKLAGAGRAGRFYTKWLPQLAIGPGQLPGTYTQLGALAPHMRYVERSSRKLARSTFYAMVRWQAKLEYRQAFLGRIVDIGAELFAMSAAVAYADLLAREQPDRGAEAWKLAELFCTQAKRRAERLFHELWHNDDDVNRAAAEQVLSARYEWLESGILDPSGAGPMMPDQPDTRVTSPARD